MEMIDIKPGDCYLAEIPQGDGEIQDLVLPLTYLGNRRWKVEQAHTGQILYVNVDKILCRTTPENGTSATAEVVHSF